MFGWSTPTLPVEFIVAYKKNICLDPNMESVEPNTCIVLNYSKSESCAVEKQQRKL